MEHSESTLIGRSLDDVWGYVGDVRWWPKWLSDVSDVRLISDELAPGSEVAYKWRGKDVTTSIAEYEPRRKIGIASIERGYDFHESIAVDAVDDHTKVTFTMGFTPTSVWMRILSVLLGPFKSLFLARPLRDELETLRNSLESDPPS